jgi:hypothetical protein
MTHMVTAVGNKADQIHVIRHPGKATRVCERGYCGDSIETLE